MSNNPMAEIRASFFIECEELIESLQDALAILDEGGSDPETINVVFRAVHSIKGGAGAFGFDALVAFAHCFETALDELRSGRRTLTPEAMKLFFQSADLLHDHIVAAKSGDPAPAGTEETLEALEVLAGTTAAEEEAVEFTVTSLDFDFDFGAPENAAPPDWTIRFRPHAALYASGNETLLILRALSRLGDCRVDCDIPSDLSLDPAEAEQPELAWTITLPGDVAEDDILQAFDFVTDVCDLEITADAPQTGLAEEPATDPQPETPAAEERAADEPPLLLDSSAIVAAANEDAPMQTAAPPAPAPARAPAKSGRPEPDSAAATVRVDLDRVDRLVNLVGELVINQAMLAQSVAEAGMAENPSVMNGLEEFMMLTRDIQDGVMMIRAQPVKPLFQRMGRIIREASSAVGKSVRLRTEGEATEVDKTVIERLADPLTHMIRNAVDHGIEVPERRTAAGKPEEGAIVLSAMHRAGRVLIEVTDDGAGINRPRVREIAVSKGLIPPDAVLTDAEIDNLLFLPGFSTASQVSALSGRGVGMDVVKSAITALGGRITITSEPGKGTRFSISLPLTLAVLDGMVVRVAEQTLVVPLSSIVETAMLTPEDMRRIGRSTDVLHIRGELLPLFDLGVQLGYRRVQDTPQDGIVILTTQEDGSRVALIVDAIMEQRQVVIKGLSRAYAASRGIAAATILGDGQVALILDPSDLVRPRPPASETELPLAG